MTNLREEAFAVFRAGIEAVRADVLVKRALQINGDELTVGGEAIELSGIRRIVVVGAGKAGAAMAEGVVAAVGPRLKGSQSLAGWVNVPDGSGGVDRPVRIFEARPTGENLPTERVVAGTREIVRLISELREDDICFCLISGGGSALLASPADGVTLDDKRAVSTILSANKAQIQQLNRVRRQISKVKGGRLLDTHRAGRIIALIISDIIGDPIDLIASGPTVFSTDDTPESALAVFDELGISRDRLPYSVRAHLERAANELKRRQAPPASRSLVTNLVIGNIEVAIQAAANEARRLRFDCETEIQLQPDVLADDEGRRLARRTQEFCTSPGRKCLVSGGEPIVEMCSSPGLGGRNQQLVLAATNELLSGASTARRGSDFCLLAGGTDGEDGNTSAAGALVDGELLAASRERRIEPSNYLMRNDAFTFFELLNGLVVTGPTGTNVCDLRVVLTRG